MRKIYLMHKKNHFTTTTFTNNQKFILSTLEGGHLWFNIIITDYKLLFHLGRNVLKIALISSNMGSHLKKKKFTQNMKMKLSHRTSKWRVFPWSHGTAMLAKFIPLFQFPLLGLLVTWVKTIHSKHFTYWASLLEKHLHSEKSCCFLLNNKQLGLECLTFPHDFWRSQDVAMTTTQSLNLLCPGQVTFQPRHGSIRTPKDR